MITAEAFRSLANSQGAGYLKAWKAQSILCTLQDIPGILEDRERLRSYLTGCLVMEGFNSVGIDNLVDAILAEK